MSAHAGVCLFYKGEHVEVFSECFSFLGKVGSKTIS